MHRFDRSQGLLLGYSSIVALGSLLVLSQIISSPSEPASAVIFGFSIPRLAMVFGLFIIFISYLTLALKVAKNQEWAMGVLERWFDGKGVSQRLGWLITISFVLGWIGCFLPVYRVGTLGNYWVRVQPFMVFVLFASLATLSVFFVVRRKWMIRDLDLTPLKLGLPLFLFCILGLVGMFSSGFGVASLEDYWYGAGVPVLVMQLVVAILCGIFFMKFEFRWRSKRLDILIGCLIFIFTAYCWAREPLRESFLFTGPSYPNHVFYPFADAATFDSASQFPLIGSNFFVINTTFFERPLYLSFLVYLHSLFGQDYEKLMAVQAVVFAILPVLIYWIGKSLNYRAVGFSSAIIVTLRGINSIAASNMIDMANPKMMLTDFPAAIGVALTILFICEWLKEPEANRHYLVWIGGTLGFTLMLRTNALLLLAFIPLYLLLKLSTEWKRWLISSSLIFLGVVAITLPWEIRNLTLGGQMYGPIVTKFQNVIKQRYQPVPKPGSFLPQDYGFSSLLLKSTQPISKLYSISNVPQDNQACDGVICFSTNHFLHNILTSILILPTSPMLDDLRYLIRERNPYYWSAEWDGTFQGTAPLFLVFNLFFVTTGVVFAWRERRLAGVTPLVIFLVYNISNGLARTSGGRYIVPVDWIIVLYYLLGVLYIITWVANSVGGQWSISSTVSGQDLKKTRISTRISTTLLAFVVLLGFGSLIPFSETLQQPRYQSMSPMETLYINRALIKDAGLKPDDLDKFLQSTDASIFIGRALYPRYYKMDQGDAAFGVFYPYITMGFPRMAFKVIGPMGERSVVLPGDAPQYFPHASDVLVLGCKGNRYFDALVVIVLGDNNIVYTRKPESGLQCPLQQPVCKNNSVCR